MCRFLSWQTGPRPLEWGTWLPRLLLSWEAGADTEQGGCFGGLLPGGAPEAPLWGVWAVGWGCVGRRRRCLFWGWIPCWETLVFGVDAPGTELHPSCGYSMLRLVP